MSLIAALVALKGGVGRTTLTANLTSVIVQGGRRCIAVDLDPQNGLHHHFGVEPGSLPSVCDPGEPAARGTSPRGVRARAVDPCVPFAWGEHRAVDKLLAAHPEWLRQRLEIVAAGSELVLLDTPGHHSPWLIRALEIADLVLIVTNPDPASYATLPATEELVREVRGARVDGSDAWYVVNRFDGGSPLSRDVLGSLRGAFKGRVLSTVIHEDPTVREAIARQRTLVSEASDSQVLADLGELAEWLIGRLDQPRAGRTGARR